MVIEVGKFYKMKNDSMAEYGFAKGDNVFIIGSGMVPNSKTDPYKYRLVFVGTPVTDGHVKLEENGKPNGYTVDARNLVKVTAPVLKKLEANKEADFGGQAEKDQAV